MPASEYRVVFLRCKDGTVVAHTIVDAGDYEWISRHRWSLDKPYACRGEWNDGNSRKFLLHREIMGLKLGDPRTVDHINRDPTDNRRENLRIIPHGAQSQNRGSYPNTTSKYRGVHWSPNAKMWRARVRNVHVGYFSDEADAAEAARGYRLAHMPYAVD